MKDRMPHTQTIVDQDRSETAVDDQQRVDAIVERGPSGAFAVAGVAVAIVIAIWFAFYFLVYLPRGVMQ
jgi:hypothetical protein